MVKCGQYIFNPHFMELTEEQFEQIKDVLPVKRGNVTLEDLAVLRAILYVAENGCKWRGLPERFGNWYTIYTRMNRWAKAGILNRVFAELQKKEIIRVTVESVSLDSTIVKVHPDGTGALKKTANRQLGNHAEDGQRRFIWLPQMLERQ